MYAPPTKSKYGEWNLVAEVRIFLYDRNMNF